MRYVTASIESLHTGDWVLARGQWEPYAPLVLQRIEEVFERMAYQLTIVTLRSSSGLMQTLYTTSEHPVYVPGRGWVACRELAVGDELLEPAGGVSTVVQTRYERYPRGITVYNFRVAESHTYFVREKHSDAEPVWVHNACLIKPNDIRPYGDFRNFPGDDLAGHEILQNSWLNAAEKADLRPANPSLALGPDEHALVTSAQRLAGLLDGPPAMQAMTALENASANISILRSLSDTIGVPMSVIDELDLAVQRFIKLNRL